jgi:flagellar motor switch protein FliM
MGDKVLSQQEIEALLRGLAPDSGEPTAAPPGTAPAAPTPPPGGDPGRGWSAPAKPGAAPGKPVKLYDFRRPDRFSKDHLRALRILHVTFARMLSSSLSSYLRTSVQVRLTMVEETTYDDYIRALPSPTVMYIISPEPLPRQAVLEVNLPVARAMLDRLLGGSGSPSARSSEMTEIELTLLRTLGNYLMASLREAWANVVSLRPSFQEPVLSPEFVQITMLTESTVTLVFEVSVLQVSGTMSLCIPHPVLQPVLDNLTSQVWSTGVGQPATENTPIAGGDELAPVTLPVTVELGRTELALRELLTLAPGQVLRLDTPSDGELAVRVGEHVKFLGRAGTVGRQLAVQLTRVLD